MKGRLAGFLTGQPAPKRLSSEATQVGARRPVWKNGIVRAPVISFTASILAAEYK